MTQKERSELRPILRDRRFIQAMNEVLENLPMKDEDATLPLDSERAAHKYYFHAGALAAFNSLLRLGYSLQEAGPVHQKVKVPQFRPEKKL